ncbi:MAG TPA: VWA domain-containing protein [Vicinamibacteria bacterium]|nr:VWA domain-containing protein [Vicinamibacteria bacterium]
MRRLALSIASCGLAVVSVAVERPARAAPEARQRGPVFPIDLEMVNLTLSVRDEDGMLVGDLGADEFVVYEDGRPQTITLFARAGDGGSAGEAAEGSDEARRGERALTLDLGMLFDTSESMIKEMRFAQEAASRFLESIPRARDLLTVFFDQDIRVSRYDSEHQQGLMARIFESKGGGNTALYDAITVYISRVTDTSGRKILVLFTDGEENTSATSLQELLALVRSSTVTIYPIAFTGHYAIGSNRGLSARSFLQNLADLSGGRVFTPRTSRDLPGIYEKILAELKAQYVIGYVSDNADRDGGYRKLRVEVKREGLKVRARQGYTAPRD